jgi:glyoxylase-like metal-dependent hydrolase (beta-lactamase superfamily II)
MEIHKFITGPLENNTYLVYNETGAGLLIDPSKGCDEILAFCREKAIALQTVLLTHGHFDHILGLDEIGSAWPSVTIYLHPLDQPFLEDAFKNGSTMVGLPYTYKGNVSPLREGALTVASFNLTVLHVPGHTPGGCAFVFTYNNLQHCFSGDALFAGSIGRSDFPMGDGELLLKSIREKLLLLPDTTVVYPGHGGRTTIGREKRLNPFLQNGN